MDISADLQAKVQLAISDKTPLNIHGGQSKAFYGNNLSSKTALDVSLHNGIISYEPSELVIRVRAGTKLIDLEQILSEQNQILPFEPPIHNSESTIGGAIAAGLSGPRRPFSGSVSDAVLGIKIISGEGKILEFGGQVMKNVAGYDVSRLMVGSMGIFGVILDISLKLIPKPEVNITHAIKLSQTDSIHYFLQQRDNNQPVTATCFYNDTAFIRYSGSSEQMRCFESVPEKGLLLENNDYFWYAIRNQTHPFFADKNDPLWRFVLPISAPVSQTGKSQLIEWNGAQRWVKSKTPSTVMIGQAKKYKGNISLFRGEVVGMSPFTRPPKAVFSIYKTLKNKLDPHHIFNPGRMYEEL